MTPKNIYIKNGFKLGKKYFQIKKKEKYVEMEG